MVLKKITLGLILVSFSMTLQAQQILGGGGEANPDLKTNKAALKKFQDMRFGMFIHWGPVTLRGTEIAWSRGHGVDKDDYDALYKEFNPMLFDANQWVKAAKEAGMKYLVLTTRHHDGFSLWDSQYSDYDMANTPYGKGIIKPLVDACKREGIVFGAYYSICDWRDDNYPISYLPEDKDRKKDLNDPATKKGMKTYITFMKYQLKELIDNYDPEIIWFDGEWEWPWTHEMGMDMYKYLRTLKEDLLINNRVDKGRKDSSGYTKSPIYAGDYGTPEQRIGTFNNTNPWETNMTIGTQWAWKPNDKLKSLKTCITNLLQTVGGDGNFLFNVGPMLDGRIEQRQVAILKQMGNWLKINGEAVYETHGGPYLPSKNMVSTHKDNKLYIHLLEHSNKNIKLPFPENVKIKQAYFLDGGTKVQLKKDNGMIHLTLPETLPDNNASVIVLELNKPAATIDLIKI